LGTFILIYLSQIIETLFFSPLLQLRFDEFGDIVHFMSEVIFGNAIDVSCALG